MQNFELTKSDEDTFCQECGSEIKYNEDCFTAIFEDITICENCFNARL